MRPGYVILSNFQVTSLILVKIREVLQKIFLPETFRVKLIFSYKIHIISGNKITIKGKQAPDKKSFFIIALTEKGIK